MRIAITQRVVENNSYPERRDALDQAWAKLLLDVMPESVLLPIPNNPDSALTVVRKTNINGLILSGGEDWGKFPERDSTEQILFSHCQSAGLPVLGVCRGLHVINKLLGGKTAPPLQSTNTPMPHVEVHHSVQLKGDTFLSMSESETILVNSYHCNGLIKDAVAGELITFAISSDGIMEGMHHASKPILAVQWHPERSSPFSDFDKSIIRSIFIKGAFWKND